MARREFNKGWDAYEHAEVYSEWAVTQKELGGAKGRPHYEVVYCSHMLETTDGEASPKEEAPTLDPRSNYPNRAHSPKATYLANWVMTMVLHFYTMISQLKSLHLGPPQAKIDNKWGWTLGYGILHTGPCDRCEGYQQHLATAIGIGVPSVVTAGNYP